MAESIRFIAENFPTGLVGTIGVTLENGSGSTVLARTTSGITESPTGSGRYVKTVSINEADFPVAHIWDSGSNFASGVVPRQVSKTSIREGVNGHWQNELSETFDLTVTG